MGFLKRIPRDPKTGRTLPFPPSAVQKSGKVMALAPELFEEGEAIDATKVDVFALGSVCFCLTVRSLFPCVLAFLCAFTSNENVEAKFLSGLLLG